MLTERLGDRSNVTNVIVVLTNGWSTNPEYTKVSIKSVLFPTNFFHWQYTLREIYNTVII